MKKYTLDYKKFVDVARNAVSEGCVLLKNSNQVLPLQKNAVVSVFGRIQLDYYKSGTGSGGMVNVAYVRSILDAMIDSKDISVNETLLQIYKDWVKENPFDLGIGWANEPKSQKEMPLKDAIVKEAASKSDVAIVIIGRSAGEDSDTLNEEGSYLLQKTEEDVLKKVRKHFKKMIVLLNVGNIIDMKWAEIINPDAIMYVWQGGMEGGEGIVKLLTGEKNPSGKLTDTIARNIEDYPSTPYFGNKKRNCYVEDIYVGYRYFETFAKEKVLYPFGFGLSYTKFDINASLKDCGDTIEIESMVTNIGNKEGKEVVQIYVKEPQGKLGKPSRELKGYYKTDLLLPGTSQRAKTIINKGHFASFDDGGKTGNKNCFVLEEGIYEIYIGSDVRSARLIGSFIQKETEIIQRLSGAVAPVTQYKRIVPAVDKTGEVSVAFEDTPVYDGNREKQTIRKSKAIYKKPKTKKTLSEVKLGKLSMDEFVAQLSDEDLCHIVKGEGMCSPKATPGVAAAFGGITEELKSFGIPVACCADGPSGIRMDSGANAFSLPSGTLLGCSFNDELVRELFEFEGLEMRLNRIDSLLGPGINIHRNPLNGRNFEYISEDPYLTGMIASAELEGLNKAGVSGTVKHFCGNNQETCRHKVDSVISSRALREIYLKPYEIVVNQGFATSIMSTYGAVNGLWTAGYKQQNTDVLRDEWGYDGILMTDWWPVINEEDKEPSRDNLSSMVWAQNDLFMVVGDTTEYKDNLKESLSSGKLTRDDLLKTAANICYFVMRMPCMDRMMGVSEDVIVKNKPAGNTVESDFDMVVRDVKDGETISISDTDTTKGRHALMNIRVKEMGIYDISITGRLPGKDMAQVNITLRDKGTDLATFSYHGSQTSVTVTQRVDLFDLVHYLSAFYSEGGFEAETISFKRIKDIVRSNA